MKTRLILTTLTILSVTNVASAQTLTRSAQPAQQTTQSSTSSAPLTISADNSLEWDRTNQTFTAQTNAKAEQDGVSITATTLTAAYRANEATGNDFEIHTMTARESVIITSEDNQAFGDQAVYKLDTQIATMTGQNLRLTTPEQTITARDRFEYHAADGRLLAIGNAKIQRPTDTIEAATIQATLAENQKGERTLKTMTATDNVIITTATERITGQKGTYDAQTEQAEITGGVTLTRGPNILKGDRATVDLKTGISKLFAASAKGGRVTGTFYPGSEDN